MFDTDFLREYLFKGSCPHLEDPYAELTCQFNHQFNLNCMSYSTTDKLYNQKSGLEIGRGSVLYVHI